MLKRSSLKYLKHTLQKRKERPCGNLKNPAKRTLTECAYNNLDTCKCHPYLLSCNLYCLMSLVKVFDRINSLRNVVFSTNPREHFVWICIFIYYTLLLLEILI